MIRDRLVIYNKYLEKTICCGLYQLNQTVYFLKKYYFIYFFKNKENNQIDGIRWPKI
jgi:hypothetical protein